MMKLTYAINIFILAFALVFTNSCGGKKKKKTSAKIVLGNIFSGDTSLVSGGVMIFASHRQSPQRIAVKYTGQILELENGNWDIAALAWENQAFSGTLRCGLTSVVLNGADVEAPLSLNTSNCLNDFFGPAETKDSTGAPNPLSFATCGNRSCLYDNYNPKNISIKGIAQSYQVSFPGFTFGPAGATESLGVVSPCFTPSGNTTLPASLSSLKVPILAFPVPTIIRAYDEAGCGSDYDQYLMVDGIKNPIPDVTFFQSIPGLTNTIRLTSNLCRTVTSVEGSLYRHSTSGTAGAIEQHIICNASQMDNMVGAMATAANRDDIYILGQDIDYTSVTPSGPIGASGTEFAGIFYGNDYTISNYTSADTPGSDVGIFGVIKGGTALTFAKITHLKLNDITINHNDSAVAYNVGILVGNMEAYSKVSNVSLNIADLKVVDGTAQKEDFGGLVGAIKPTGGPTLNSVIVKVSVNDVMLNMKNNKNVGGIVGRINDGGSLLESTATNIKAKNNSSTLSNLGGAVGNTYGEIRNIVTSVAFDQTLYAIQASGSIGGVIGYVGDSTVATNATNSELKATGTINLTGAGYTVGGVVGTLRQSSTAFLENAISEVVITTPSAFGIGGIVGSALLVAGGPYDMKFVRNYGNISCAGTCGGIIGTITDTAGSIKINNAHNYGNVTSTGFSVGGIVGAWPSNTANSEIMESHNEGSISGGGNVGGIVGNRSGAGTGLLKKSYNTGNITSITGFSGGIAGNLGNVSPGTAVVQLYNVGNVTTSSGTTAWLFGSHSGFSGACYYDSTKSGTQLVGGGPGIGCTDVSADITNITNYNTPAIDPAFVDDPNGGSPVLANWNTLETLGASYLGSPIDPFQLSTTTQWNAISDNGFLMDKAYKLANDLDFLNGGVSFTPIGSSTNPFIGQFLGNNNTIRNVTLSETSATEQIGVFREIGSGARFDSEVNGAPATLTLENINFTSDFSGGGSAGGIFTSELTDSVGAGNDILIRDIIISGGSLDSPADENGSLIGKLSLTNNQTEIRHITSSATILDCFASAGGIIGAIYDTGITLKSNIEHLFFNGTFDNGGCSTASYVGGVVGSANSSDIMIKNSINTANVYGVNAGGIISNGTVELFAVANKGNVSGSTRAGGVMAYANGLTTLSTVYSTGSVSGGTVGAILGQSTTTTTISNSYAAPLSVNASTTDYFSGDNANTTYTNNLYFRFGNETVADGTIAERDVGNLYDVFTTSTLTTGLTDNPWMLFPGEAPKFHFEQYPEYFTD
ncbi:hypothetical protein OAT67_02770 [Bacteriovoracaceae bacterium]|nr:hypothetical protein [Bacteriovoracaceae bacterium]